ncbi:cytochrome P450 4B1 [Xenopus tropicalis]|uniref:Cytochrome P450 4B1 n=1 Tax=Xenopus tropicalis TaxID=8364 RepID=F6PHY2_XENTR|nr:cytochrome P450 4B1 [Xenopus tropicalis]|eukprot:XP_002931492.1 PREDICTED: cytochrome P450 4B1-like [Xenopus tropicalis]
MASNLWEVLSSPGLPGNIYQFGQFAALLCLILLLLKACGLFIRWKSLKDALQNFPGPPKHWLYGNANQFRNDGTDMDRILLWANKYPKAFPLWVGQFFASLVITNPEYAKAAFARSDPKTPTGYDFLIPWIGKGLLVLSGDTWFQHRRLLTPGFHYDVLKPYAKLISDSTKVMLDKWVPFSNKGEPVELFHHVSLMTLDSIMKCAFSYHSNCQTDNDNSYTKAVYDLSYLTHHRARTFPYHNNLIYYLSPHGFLFRKACRIAHQHTDKVIKQRKTLLQNKEEFEKVKQKRHPDFLDILLCARDENGKGLSDEDLRAEVDTFMFEGHDTTASGISWILYCMAKYPEHQQKCREEIRDVLGEKESFEWEDLNKIPYTTMCIKESLRLYPPVPAVSRELNKPITFSDGRSLPAGSVIFINIFCIHRNPTVWKDPEVFDPLRFSSENSSKRHSHAFVPFAAGPRNCIGQNFAMNELKVAVALTLNRYELSPDLSKAPLKSPQLVLRSKNGIHVYLKKASY